MAYRWQKYGEHAHLAIFGDRAEAEAFAAQCRVNGQAGAHVSTLSSLVMTSDNSPCVWVSNVLRDAIDRWSPAPPAEQVSA